MRSPALAGVFALLVPRLLGSSWAHSDGGKADEVDLCGLSGGQGPLCGLESYSGLVPLSRAGSLFYWYFVPRDLKPNVPLILWLQGGPGASSMLGNFFEMGPVTLDSQGQLQARAPGQIWASRFPILFVDSPVGTGWSTATDDSAFARNQTAVARDLATLLHRFAELHPEAPKRLVIAGESYGGHYVPALGAYLLDHPGPMSLEAVMVGDGLTDPAVQVLTKPQEAFAFGLVDEKQLAEAQRHAQKAHELALAGEFVAAAKERSSMEDLVQSASLINLYDVRTAETYDWQEARMQRFFGQNATKDLLHVPRHSTFGARSQQVEEYLMGDIMQSKKQEVEQLLEAGIRVLLYQGQFDWKDGVVSNEAWIRSLAWPGVAGYLNASREVWRRAADGKLAGYWRKFRNLEQVVVLGAGHMVPMDQPLSAVDLIERFLGRQVAQLLV